jgi:hypothetical protein
VPGELARRFHSLDGALVEFGVAGAHPSGMEAAELAGILIAGTDDGKIPARDFITVAADEARGAIDRGLRLAAQAALAGRDPRRPLERARDAAHAAVERAIETWADPGNAASTIRAKGKDDPLVDKGDLLDLTFAGYALGALAREVTRGG